MNTENFIIDLFCFIDDKLGNVKKHSQASLHVSEVITLSLLFALKGRGNRPFYRWLKGNYSHLFPRLPHRTRLFHLFNSHSKWTNIFMAETSLFGVIDSYGIELIHPRREGRSQQQIGKKGISNQRWIVGGKLCLLLNKLGLIVDWDCDTANVYDGSAFQDMVEKVADQMIVFADTGFVKNDWHPHNLKICKRGQWNDRMRVETTLSMLTLVCHFKKVMHRKWKYFKTRLASTMALFNILVQWNGIQSDENGFVHHSIARFSL